MGETLTMIRTTINGVLNPECVPRGAVDLAEVANREYDQAISHARAAVEHGMAAGEALLAARRLVPPGEWTTWCRSNITIAPGSVGRLMRLAHYKEMVVAAGRTQSLNDALAWLTDQHLPALRETGGTNRTPTTPEQEDDMRRLRDAGVPVSEIASQFGVGQMVVRGRTDAKYMPAKKARDRRQRQRAARAAVTVKDARRDSMVSDATGPLADAYELIRRACNLVDQYNDAESVPVAAPERVVTKALRGAMRVLARLTAPQTFRGMVLRCDCGFIAENVSSLSTHTRRKHERMPTVAERTPRPIDEAAA